MTAESLSLRDPDGRLHMVDDRVIRWVKAEKNDQFEKFLRSGFVKTKVADGTLVGSQALSGDDADDIRQRLATATQYSGEPNDNYQGGLYEHKRVDFISYPYEWPASMLLRAGQLTLELALEAMASGYRMKDATPYNVLFRGPEPTFVDVLSFEERPAGDPLWAAEGQFIRTFLLPLLAERDFSLEAASVLALYRDGVQPDLLYQFYAKPALLSRSVLRYVALPVWLAKKADDPAFYDQKLLDNTDRADFIYERVFGRLKKALTVTAPKTAGRSHWIGYMADLSYSNDGFSQKEQFVSRALETVKPNKVLDAGANTGHFSFLSAKAGASVVSLDFDAKSVDAIWHQASKEGLDVLPLIQNIADPSPALGWRNRETKPFLERAAGEFDLVLMLALIHHLMLTNGIPLEEVVELAAELSRGHCIIEYVGADDAMRQRLRRGRTEIDDAITRERFETACARKFRIETVEQVAGSDRWLYLLKKQ
jgi:2-polyprenyl-3-methyl-5-hydroxy-6-metoxy-1,4-benzoquinol methylase